jgi:hypothetical protein
MNFVRHPCPCTSLLLQSVKVNYCYWQTSNAQTLLAQNSFAGQPPPTDCSVQILSRTPNNGLGNVVGQQIKGPSGWVSRPQDVFVAQSLLSRPVSAIARPLVPGPADTGLGGCDGVRLGVKLGLLDGVRLGVKRGLFDGLALALICAVRWRRAGRGRWSKTWHQAGTVRRSKTWRQAEAVQRTSTRRQAGAVRWPSTSILGRSTD